MEDWAVATNKPTDILFSLKHLSNIQKENDVASIIYDFLESQKFSVMIMITAVIITLLITMIVMRSNC